MRTVEEPPKKAVTAEVQPIASVTAEPQDEVKRKVGRPPKKTVKPQVNPECADAEATPTVRKRRRSETPKKERGAHKFPTIKPETKTFSSYSETEIPSTDDQLRDMVLARSCPYMGVQLRKGGTWSASWYENDGQRVAYFHPARYRTAERTEQEADVEALRDAIRCRLANAGTLGTFSLNPDKYAKEAGTVAGVSWKKTHRSWVTQRKFGGKWLWCKYFTPEDFSKEAVQAAHQKAITYCREQEALLHSHYTSAVVDGLDASKDVMGVS